MTTIGFIQQSQGTCPVPSFARIYTTTNQNYTTKKKTPQHAKSDANGGGAVMRTRLPRPLWHFPYILVEWL